jgi:hypothetical protein
MYVYILAHIDVCFFSYVEYRPNINTAILWKTGHTKALLSHIWEGKKEVKKVNVVVVLSTQEWIQSQAPVAHSCNPSYSGGRDQEDYGLKPAQANSSQDPSLKIYNTKRAGRVA